MLVLTNCMNKQPFTSHRFEKFLEACWKLECTYFFQVCHIKCILRTDIQHAYGLRIQFLIYPSRQACKQCFRTSNLLLLRQSTVIVTLSLTIALLFLIRLTLHLTVMTLCLLVFSHNCNFIILWLYFKM